MPEVFADTFYWIALLNPADNWHQRAISVSQTNAELSLVTTEAVLTEMLNYFSAAGEIMRNSAAALCDHAVGHAGTIVLPQTREAFVSGLDLYKARPDKAIA